MNTEWEIHRVEYIWSEMPAVDTHAEWVPHGVEYREWDTHTEWGTHGAVYTGSGYTYGLGTHGVGYREWDTHGVGYIYRVGYAWCGIHTE